MSSNSSMRSEINKLLEKGEDKGKNKLEKPITEKTVTVLTKMKMKVGRSMIHSADFDLH